MTSTFDYQKPKDEYIPRIEAVKQAFRDLADRLAEQLTENRCTSLTRTKLEEACMWAIKGIVFESEERD